MKTIYNKDLVKEGVQTLYEEFGPLKTIKFFQLIGIQKGDTLKEIEEITKNLNKKEALKLVNKVK